MSSDSELGSSGSGVRPRHILPLAALLALLVAFFGLRGTVLAVPVTVVDDAGADDEPGQKDLSFLTIDYAPVTPGTIDVSWGWDDTVKSGANTSDACTLFDTDMDGDANYSLCITADGSPLTFLSIRLYACTADNRTDRCAGPSEITTFSSTGTASVVPGSDPFGTTGRAGNDCDADPACLSDDTVATAQVVLSDFGGGSAKLLNICSYPSREPNSDPSDCVITPDSGFLTIVKVADPDDTTQFTFNLGVGQTSQDGSTSWIIEGSGSQSLISFEADTGYDLSEVIPAGWDLTSAACEIQTAPPTLTGTQTATGVDDFEIQSGLETICTFNDVQDASLTLAKLVTNDNGGTAAAADWTLTAAGPSGFSGPGPSVSSPAGFSAGTYDLSESGPGGYTASDWVCAGGTQNDSDTITLAPGESATCTITNDDDAPSLTLVKAIVNDGGGSAVESDWTLTAAGPTGFSGAGPSVSNGASFDAGTYDLSESGPGGYTASDWVCVGGTQNDVDTVTLGLGESATCTITNDDIDQATLTLVKVLPNDNGGTATDADFPVFIDGNPVTWGAANPLPPGNYTASETPLAGYTPSGWGGDCNPDGTVSLAPGENKTCTITNDDDAPSLTLEKVVIIDNGGTATAADWMLTAAGPTGFSGSGPSVSNGASFDAGTYDLSESGPGGYDASDWVCVGGTQDDADTITLGLGESATCTITNDDQQATVTVVKVVNNDNGGSAAPDDFLLTLDGAPVTSGVAVPVNPGTYTAGETLLPGYSFSGFSGDCDVNGDVTVALGENKTCTLTNDDQQATVTVVKVVNNDNGGSAAPDDFLLTLDGNPVTSGVAVPVNPGTYTAGETLLPGYSFSGFSGDCDVNGQVTVALGENKTCTLTNDDQQATVTVVKVVNNDNGGSAAPDDFLLTLDGNPVSSGVAVPVNPGTYTAGETLLPGYSFSGFSGDCDVNGQVTVALGENKTCTLTNDDDAPSLTLEKVVVNDNGGSAVESDWTLTAAGPTGFSGPGPSVNNGASFDAGTYDLSESGPAGYTASDWVCVGGTQGDADTISLGLGESATCTITNDDDAPSLTLEKVVMNDNGGTATAADWMLTAAGPTGFSGSGPSVSNGASFDAGTYDLSESGPGGYDASDWVCVGGTQDDADTITLGLGESATCTITNVDIAPTLRLVKTVDNGDGGNAVADDWTLFAAAAAPNDGRNFSNPGGSGVFETVFANAGYDLSESAEPGYAADPWSCDGGTLVGSMVTLALDEDVTCTINNDDVAPTLKLVKTVDNGDGGSAVADDWTLFAAAAAPNDGRNFSNFGGSGVFETVFANAGYDLSESAEPGYEAGPWNCDGGTLVGSTITLDEGDEVICTITNDDIAPTLTIVKAVNGSDPPTWSFTGPAPFGMFTLPAGGGSKGPEDVMAGEDITVAEDDVTNPDSSTAWVLTSIECTDGTSGNLATRDVTVNLDLDENVTCTFTNDKIAISIVKTTADDFSNEGDGIGILPGENVTWNYLVTNTGVAQLDNIVVTDDQGVTVTCPQTSLAPGESMTCTASGIAAAGSYHNIGTVTGENSGTEITDSDPSSYFGLTPGVVTNSSLCDFGEQFRLIFTPDIKNYTASNPAYKLSDSNPGQFFYNVFYVNDSDPLAQTITMEIPYPFVTQGANPVHVYGGVFVNPENEMNCFEPANELASYGEIITLASYTDTNGDGMVGFGDVVLVDVPAEEGFQYVNIHLDYGLEKSNGWIKKGANAVNDPLINPNFTGISIIDNTAHTFKAYVDGVLLAGSTDTIYNLNEFKQIRGFGGTVQYWNGVSFEPLAGAQVQLIGPGGNVIETMTTDGDGWYLSNYQHKGKAATYTLRLLAGVAPSGPYGQQQVTGILVGGSVKFGEGNFLIP